MFEGMGKNVKRVRASQGIKDVDGNPNHTPALGLRQMVSLRGPQKSNCTCGFEHMDSIVSRVMTDIETKEKNRE